MKTPSILNCLGMNSVARKNRTSRRRRKRAPRVSRLEQLEGRQLMTTGFSFLGGILTLTADTEGSQVTITDTDPAGYQGAGMPIVISAASPNGTWVRALPRGAVHRVEFEGSNVDDVFDASSLGLNPYTRAGIAVVAHGGGGNDRLYGGAGNDWLYGEGGYDTLVGNNGRDTLDGGSGSDRLYGDGSTTVYDTYTDSGSGRTAARYRYGSDDTLIGGSGIDRLYGGGGNDHLDGGSERDYLYGGHGDDVLQGGSGGDRLYGQVGNDDLYGGSGNDYLYGHEGNDALVGGTGTNYVRGDLGNDRFLLITDASGNPISDTIGDGVTRDDAKVNFVNGTTNDVRLGSNIGWVRAFAASWTSEEIEWVDSAFDTLVNVSNGNTEMLKKSNGAELTFVRQGTVRRLNSDGSLGLTNFSVGGWNSDGQVTIVDNRFNGGEDDVVRVVFHEIAHNWDEAQENSFVPLFRSVAGWTQFSTNPGFGWEGARDGGWSNWYFRNRDSGLDGFARTYGKMNPLEDYATTFAAYMMSESGRDYFGESPEDVRERLDDRFAVLDYFFSIYRA